MRIEQLEFKGIMNFAGLEIKVYDFIDTFENRVKGGDLTFFAGCIPHQRVLILFPEFTDNRISPESREFTLLHEVGHMLFGESEKSADDYAISQTSRAAYEKCMQECSTVLAELRAKKIAILGSDVRKNRDRYSHRGAGRY